MTVFSTPAVCKGRVRVNHGSKYEISNRPAFEHTDLSIAMTGFLAHSAFTVCEAVYGARFIP